MGTAGLHSSRGAAPPLPLTVPSEHAGFWGEPEHSLPLGAQKPSPLTSGLAAMFWRAEGAGNPTSGQVGYYCNTLHLGKERMWVI